MGFGFGKSKVSKENEAELARLRQTISSTNAELNGTKTQIQNLRQQHEQLQIQSTFRESRDAAIINDLSNRLRGVEEEKHSLQDVSKEFSKELNLVWAKAEASTLEAVRRDEQIEALQQTLCRIRLGDGSTVDTEDLRSIVQAQSTELQRLESQVESKNKTLLEAQEALSKETQRNADLFAQLHVAANQSRELKQQLRKVRAESSSMEETLNAQNRELEARMRVLLQEQEARSRAELERFYRDLETAVEEKGQLRAELQRRQDELNTKVARIQALETELAENNEMMVTARQNLNQTRNQLSIEQRKARMAAQENADKDKKMKFLQQQCVAMHFNIEALRKESRDASSTSAGTDRQPRRRGRGRGSIFAGMYQAPRSPVQNS
ncbi:hypothetical protein BCR34DRAFT_564733 [Clohesyomyces aquaticus]|uniref:Uncharacterized protein n=1 Tax=Clohesyomyces aquaticus TaxID=1231657 RepID=A0A1Y1ZNN4_9PLEO|nr:hypothetical protein BCR34DRAFT_564733 [Clohesyomyces aquaticus]